EPPPRYTEASLVKVLEEKGIGRPSTYASILTTIQDREYVTKDQGKFRPTELGTVVTDLLVKHFEDIFDVQYTARMEEELDEVEDGKMTWVEALDEFYKKFEKDLKKASKNMENLKRQEIPTDETRRHSGRNLSQVRPGQAGNEGRPFWRVYCVQQLSKMQIHQTENCRGALPQARLWRRAY